MCVCVITFNLCVKSEFLDKDLCYFFFLFVPVFGVMLCVVNLYSLLLCQ